MMEKNVPKTSVFEKMSSDQEIVRQKIMQFYVDNPGSSFFKIAKHVKTSWSTVKRTINRFSETGTVKRNAGSGTTGGSRDKNLERKVLRSLQRNPTLSLRDLAKKCNVNHVRILRIKQKHNLRSYKKYVVPRREDKQQSTAIRRSRQLYKYMVNNKNACLIMDDETYVKANFQSLPGNQFYSAKDKSIIDDKFKIIKHEKFPKKFMIWQAICQCGRRSLPHVVQGTMNSENYEKECLKKRLLPLIRSHDGPTIFWPDLASCHYSLRTTQWYAANGVNVVPKYINPPNCPELRPIEKYWAIMKLKLRKHCKEAKGIEDFKQKWIRVTKTVPDTSVRAMMRSVKSKIRLFQRKAYKK